MSERIFCIGALHFDLKLPCDMSWISHAGDNQMYADLGLSLGGTGFNLADILSKKGFDPHLFAIVGNDQLSQYCASLARDALGGSVTPLVADCPARTVALIYARDESVTYRRVAGPDWSAADAIAMSSLIEAVSSLGRGDTLFFDGYILRKRTDDLAELARVIAGKGIRCALELVPHDIGKFRTLNDLRAMLGACSHISCNVSTVESLLQLASRKDWAFQERVEAVRELLRPVSTASWHLRGGRDGAEFSALIGPEGVRYGRHNDGRGLVQSLGDSQFIDEVLAASGRTSVARG